VPGDGKGIIRTCMVSYDGSTYQVDPVDGILCTIAIFSVLSKHSLQLISVSVSGLETVNYPLYEHHTRTECTVYDRLACGDPNRVTLMYILFH